METLAKEQSEIKELETLVKDSHYSQLIETAYGLMIKILNGFPRWTLLRW